MERDGDNPNSLAAKLNQKTKQPQIYKFLEGIAREPRRSTLQPVADHYGISVEAFYDPKLAASVLANLGLGKTGDVPVQSVHASKIEPSAPGTPPTLADTLARLGRVIAESDELTRDQLKPLFTRMLDEPQRAPEIIKRIESTICSSGAGAAATDVGHKEMPGFLKK